MQCHAARIVVFLTFGTFREYRKGLNLSAHTYIILVIGFQLSKDEGRHCGSKRAIFKGTFWLYCFDWLQSYSGSPLNLKRRAILRHARNAGVSHHKVSTTIPVYNRVSMVGGWIWYSNNGVLPTGQKGHHPPRTQLPLSHKQTSSDPTQRFRQVYDWSNLNVYDQNLNHSLLCMGTTKVLGLGSPLHFYFFIDNFTGTMSLLLQTLIATVFVD